ncbi:hypothetical protein [Streptomyces spongiae]|uniref:hypothetical protein n=1 Tax=Streptomyces spongiae TaxID=565072 RepID=UPI001D13FB92|nr:hypothetical protein [Streptomyces spongiae]
MPEAERRRTLRPGLRAEPVGTADGAVSAGPALAEVDAGGPAAGGRAGPGGVRGRESAAAGAPNDTHHLDADDVNERTADNDHERRRDPCDAGLAGYAG